MDELQVLFDQQRNFEPSVEFPLHTLPRVRPAAPSEFSTFFNTPFMTFKANDE